MLNASFIFFTDTLRQPEDWARLQNEKRSTLFCGTIAWLLGDGSKFGRNYVMMKKAIGFQEREINLRVKKSKRKRQENG